MDPVGKLCIIPWTEQKARSTILDEFRDSADRAPNHREPTCQAFKVHQADRFAPECGAHKAVGSLHIGRYIHLVAEETDPGLQAQRLGKLSEVPRLRAITYDPGNDLQRKFMQGPKDDVNPLPAHELRHHEDHKLRCYIELLSDSGPCDVVGSETFGIDEIGTGAGV